MSVLDDAARKIPGNDARAMGIVAGLPCDLGWREVRRFRPRRKSAGRLAIAYVHRMPAVFWKVEIPDARVAITTGSDMAELAEAIAEAFAAGQAGLYYRDGAAVDLTFTQEAIRRGLSRQVRRALGADMLAIRDI